MRLLWSLFFFSLAPISSWGSLWISSQSPETVCSSLTGTTQKENLVVHIEGANFPENIVLNGQTYTPSRPSKPFSDLPPTDRHGAFTEAFYRHLGSELGFMVEPSSLLAISKTQPRLARQYYLKSAQGETIYRWSNITAEQSETKKLAEILGHIIGDNFHNNHDFRSLNGQLRLFLSSPSLSPDHFFASSSGQSLLGDLSPAKVRPYLTAFQKVNLDKLQTVVKELELPPEFFSQLKSRWMSIVRTLSGGMDGSFETSDDLVEKTRANWKTAQGKNWSPEFQTLRNAIRARFQADLQKHTRFRSFAEYRDRVRGIPQYTQIIESMTTDTVIDFVAPEKIRVSLITEGLKSMFESGESGVGSRGNEGYNQQRLKIASQALGMDVETYLKTIPPEGRPKSTYLHLPSEARGSDRYGADHYTTPFSRILEMVRRGEIYATLTLGVSLNADLFWQSSPVDIEDFPYFAAPFIEQFQRGSKSSSFRVLRYRKQDGEFHPITPDFLGTMAKTVDVDLRGEVDCFGNQICEDLHNPSDFIEVQLYLPTPSRIFTGATFNPSNRPSDLLMDALRKLGIEPRIHH